MGGGGTPTPQVIQAGPPPIPINPFSMGNAATGPSVAGNNPAPGGTKDWSGVMNSPQGGTPFFNPSQSFPKAPLYNGGAGAPSPLAPASPPPPAVNTGDLQTALKSMFQSMWMGGIGQVQGIPGMGYLNPMPESRAGEK